jgi:alpha-N-arabinofuranosidase
LSNLLATILYDETSGRIAIFVLNRSTGAMDLTVDLPGFGERRLLYASELHHESLKAENTRTAPNAVQPRARQEVEASSGGIRARLKPLSWNVFVTGPA